MKRKRKRKPNSKIGDDLVLEFSSSCDLSEHWRQTNTDLSFYEVIHRPLGVWCNLFYSLSHWSKLPSFWAKDSYYYGGADFCMCPALKSTSSEWIKSTISHRPLTWHHKIKKIPWLWHSTNSSTPSNLKSYTLRLDLSILSKSKMAPGGPAAGRGRGGKFKKFTRGGKNIGTTLWNMLIRSFQ